MSKTRAELTAEREQVAEQLASRRQIIKDQERITAEGRERLVKLRDRLAELDAALAVVLPDGWTGADVPPENRRTVRYAYENGGRVLVAPAFFDGMAREWRPDSASLGAVAIGKIVGTPIGWSESPADWLAPATKYPRYFTRKGGFGSSTAYLKIDESHTGEWFDDSGKSQGPFVWNPDGPEAFAERAVRGGSWLEITAEQAKAMVQPKAKPQTPRDKTNALLVALHDSPHKLSQETFDAIAERIEAFDDLAWAKPTPEQVAAYLEAEPVKPAPASEPTTERLVDVFDATVLGGRMPDNVKCGEVAAIRARILAADHSVDLRELWEPISDRHKSCYASWLAKLSEPSMPQGAMLDFVYWSGEQWVYAGDDEPVTREILALADPAKLIGGGE